MKEKNNKYRNQIIQYEMFFDTYDLKDKLDYRKTAKDFLEAIKQYY